MNHLTLKPSLSRPMTRKMCELPLKEGYKFYGIDSDGKRYRCHIRQSPDNPDKLAVFTSWAGHKIQFIGWQPITVGKNITTG